MNDTPKDANEMDLENTYNVLTKRYPLRLGTARKGLEQLKNPQNVQHALFNEFELINIVYTNTWFALEGFVDIIHTMFDEEPFETIFFPKAQPKLQLRKKNPRHLQKNYLKLNQFLMGQIIKK